MKRCHSSDAQPCWLVLLSLHCPALTEFESDYSVLGVMNCFLPCTSSHTDEKLVDSHISLAITMPNVKMGYILYIKLFRPYQVGAAITGHIILIPFVFLYQGRISIYTVSSSGLSLSGTDSREDAYPSPIILTSSLGSADISPAYHQSMHLFFHPYNYLIQQPSTLSGSWDLNSGEQ